MDIAWLSDTANVATVIGVTTALLTAVVVFRDWRHKTSHRLYIASQNLYTQDPGDPDFWVFPPKEIEDGAFALVIAGKIFNAGPSDAFSVRVFVESECEFGDALDAFDAAVEMVVALQNSGIEGYETVNGAFSDAYKDRRSLIPVIPAKSSQPFLVVARLESGDPYLKKLLGDEKNPQTSLYWEIDGKQAHGIHARSRTALGKQLSFGPEDLCAPFEQRRRRDAVRQRQELDGKS
jgi:hypothetical protein